MRTLAKSIAESAGAVSAPMALDGGPVTPAHPAPPAAGRWPVSQLPVPTVSRRSVVATMIAAFAPAAGTAVALPVVVKAAVGADQAADHPDAELLELGREYWRLDRAIAEADAVVEAYRDQEPMPRDVMRHRIDDHICGFSLPMGPETRRLSADLKHSALYSEDEIEQLRGWSSADPAERARVKDILAEWDRWTEECGALNEALGVDEAVEQIEELVPLQRPVVDRIFAIQAKTIAGLQVRAQILASISGYDDDEGEHEHESFDMLMTRALIRDLTRMAV